GTEDKAIRVRDIVFRRNNRVVAHSDPDLAESDSVDVTFGDQKTEVKDETISQDNNDDPELNPVRNMAYTIQRLRSYPGFSPDWPIYKFFDGSTFSNITSKEVLIDIRASVAAIGFDRLGYSPDDVGTHSVRSVRSSFAMMLYLAREPIYTIMLLGRWSSNAFLAYIEKQHTNQSSQSSPHPPIDLIWPQGLAQTPAPIAELTSSVSHWQQTIPCGQTQGQCGPGQNFTTIKTRSSRATTALDS
ncbi:hypothetical protein THAOC_34841, partial [Thalassiosira oceanica]